MASSSPSTLFKIEPAPWTCKCTAYVCTFWRSPSQGLPDDFYDPLEANSPAFNSADESYLGGLCVVHIIRYTSTPVGSYDELAILPGFFRQKDKGEKNTRISRIYVSQKDTCYNGRKNWNIPKHMAKFKFTGLSQCAEQQRLLANGGPEERGVRVDVFKDDPSADRPFFSATLTPIGIPLPYLPFSSTWLTTVGMNPAILQPPLPRGGSPEECETQSWKRSVAKLSGRKSSIMWCDMRLPQEGGEGGARFLPGDAGKWWAKWMIALKMEDAILEIGEPEVVEVSLGSRMH